MAKRCGLAHGAVWALTPREWYRELIVWKEREERLTNRLSTAAWMVANLSRAKKLPDLRKILVGDAAKTKPQTAAQKRQMLHTLSSQFGGSVRRTKRPARG